MTFTIDDIVKITGALAALGSVIGIGKLILYFVKRSDEKKKDEVARKFAGDLADISGDKLDTVDRVIGVYKTLAFDVKQELNDVRSEHSILRNEYEDLKKKFTQLERGLSDCHTLRMQLERENQELKLQLKIA